MGFTDLNTIKSCIRDIRKIDRNKEESYYEIYDVLKNGIQKFPILTTTLEAKDDILLYRSRVHKKDEKEFITIDDLSYVHDKNKITEYSRCNEPGQQIFYCSLDRPTSYSESLIIRKDKISPVLCSLGVWKLKKDINVGIIAHPYKDKRYTAYDIEIGEKLDGVILRDCKEIGQEVRELQYFFTIWFRFLVGDHVHYKVTAAISNILFEAVDAIIYPSVPFMGQGNNFAFKKDLIDNKSLVLQKVLIEKFNRINDLRIIQDDTFSKETDKIFHDKNEIKWD